MNINLLGAYQKIITILILMAIGFFMKKKKIISNSTQSGITNLLMKICIPITILNSFLEPFDFSKVKTIMSLTIIGLLIYPIFQLLVVKIMYLKYPKNVDKKRVFKFATSYPNAVFMGFPFVQALFGAKGLFYAAVFNLPYNLYMWSIGYGQFTKQPMTKDGIKHTLNNPVFISCLIGYAWWFIQRFIPVYAISTLSPVWDVFKLVSEITTPLSMMIIGGMVADTKFGKIISDKSVWYYVFNKLIFAPFIVIAVLYVLGFRGWTLAIPVVIFSMPSCATCAIVACQFEIEKEFTSSMVTFSTALSALTAPLWLLVIIKLM